MSSVLYKSALFRLYPTPEEEVELLETAHFYRQAFNFILGLRKMLYEADRISLSPRRWQAWVPFFQARYHASHIPVTTFRHAFEQVEAAYQKLYHKQGGYPKFKAKHRTIPAFTASQLPRQHTGLICLTRKLMIKAKWHLPLDPKSIRRVTIKQVPSGKWIASVLYAFTPSAPPKPKYAITGCDAGITHLLVPSHGPAWPNLRLRRENQMRMARLQRSQRRRTRGSCAYRRAKRRIARLHERLSSSYRYHVNVRVNRLVSENQALVLEHLEVRNMMKSRRLAKALGEAGIGYIHNRIKQKAAEYGREIIVADRWFPSSKQCSDCGTIKEDLTLKDRRWTCKICGCHHDRDRNAAKNLELWPELCSSQPRQGMAGMRVEEADAVLSVYGKLAMLPVKPEGKLPTGKEPVCSLEHSHEIIFN